MPKKPKNAWKVERKCRYKECGKTFLPKVYNQVYCSGDCHDLHGANVASFRAKNPEYWSEYYHAKKAEYKKYRPEAPVKKHGHWCKCRNPRCKRKYFGYGDMCPKCQAKRRDNLNPDYMMMMW